MSFAVFLNFFIPGKERVQLFRMDFEIHVGHPFKQIYQIFEGANAIGFAGFYHAVDGSTGRSSFRRGREQPVLASDGKPPNYMLKFIPPKSPQSQEWRELKAYEVLIFAS